MRTPTLNGTYTVQEAAIRTGLSEHTLRYYERARLIAPVHRDNSSRHRRYSDNDLQALEFLKRLRATGMPISQMQQYVTLYREGDATLEARRALLEEHGQRVREHIAELQAHLAVIEYKVANYEQFGAERNWNNDECLEIQKGSKS